MSNWAAFERRPQNAEIAEANQAYGALTEGLYIAGFTFERAMARTLALLKSGGWRLVGPGFDDVDKFVRSLALDKFNVVAEQRREFVREVEALRLVSHRALADALGVSAMTIGRDVTNVTPDGQNAPESREAPVTNVTPSAGGGRRDARIIANRDEREERREEKLRSLAEAAALAGLYSVIYADPAWEDEFGHAGRDTEIHYPTMTLDEIKALAVAEIAAPDAVLYLWALPHMIPSALEIMTAWGFEYRTEIVWGKDKIGLGAWARNQHEVLLIGRKGAFPPPPEAVRSPSLVIAPRLREHSAKPEIFAEMIERWYPESAKIELFRRGPPRSGWAAWGNEAKAAAAAPG